MTDRIIDTRGLHKCFGTTVAVADLSLSIGAGEVFGFLGPNGAGKTTSIKMLLGLVAPDGGTGMVLGAALGDRRARARVGFLPEHFRFHESLTAREMLRFHGRLAGWRGLPLEARIETLLARVDLADAADRALQGYSKGMLQRAGLAQALVNDPVLVFLDEPTSGLDPLGRLLVRDILAELRAGGTTVFLNSHMLGEVEATCDHVAFVKEGRVVQQIDMADADARVDVELRVSPVDDDLVEDLTRFGTDIRRVGGDLLRLRVTGDEVLPALSRRLVERGARLYGLQCRRKSLEERFVEVMGDDQRPG